MKIQSRQSKQKREDVKLLADGNGEEDGKDDAEGTEVEEERKMGNSGLDDDDLLDYDMNMLLIERSAQRKR